MVAKAKPKGKAFKLSESENTFRFATKFDGKSEISTIFIFAPSVEAKPTRSGRYKKNVAMRNPTIGRNNGFSEDLL